MPNALFHVKPKQGNAVTISALICMCLLVPLPRSLNGGSLIDTHDFNYA